MLDMDVNLLDFSTEVSSYPDDDMPILSKGGYQLDFDNLDAINPFQGSAKMLLSPARPAVDTLPTHQTDHQHTNVNDAPQEPVKMESALDETLPFIPSVENSLADFSAEISSTESSVVTVVKVPAAEEPDSYTATPDEDQPTKVPAMEENKESGSFAEDAPLPAKGSYNFDFDDLDAVNPFQTGGSKIQNSPVTGKKLSDNNSPFEVIQIAPSTVANVAEAAEGAQEVPAQPEVTPTDAAAPPSADAAEPSEAERVSQTADVPIKEGAIKLEFNFDDDAEVRQKPPPKKFVRKAPGLKSKAAKPASDTGPAKPAPEKPDSSAAAEAPAPKVSYSFDFDKLDDPNFNPFGTKAGMSNSPRCNKPSCPVLTENSTPEQADKPVEQEAASPPAPPPYVRHSTRAD